MEVKFSIARRGIHLPFFAFLVLFAIQSPRAQTLEEDLQQVYEDFQIMGMSVWLDVEGETQNFHYGFRDFDRDLEVNADTHYRIASVSKSFTALGLLKLYDQGLFGIDDPIKNYLPYDLVNPNHPDEDITFRMLLSHQTGLQDGGGYGPFINATFSGNTIPNLSELILPEGAYYTSNMWRSEVPGTFFAYSNSNFVLAGTLIEAISNERFDIFMKEQILNPLGINGSYNVLDLEDINDVSVLYRYQNGAWQPQWDNYEGIYPQAPDLDTYTPGTNGLYFGPQGSLRITATDTGKFLKFLSSGGITGDLEMTAETIDLMTSISWDYNGTNGDNYFDLFNRWSLGLHHANVTTGDQICNLGFYNSFIGHPGEAYGLVSDAYYGEIQDVSFTLIINGVQNGYQSGNISSYYTVEEAVFQKLCDYITPFLSVKDTNFSPLTVHPNPTSNVITINGLDNGTSHEYSIYSIHGALIISSELSPGQSQIDVTNFKSGIYFLAIASDYGKRFFKMIKN